MACYRLARIPSRGLALNIYTSYLVFCRHGRILSFWEKGFPRPNLPDSEGEIIPMNVWQLLIALRSSP
jgi:hypothetical protein